MQVTVATGLALRVWQLVDRTIRSPSAQVRVPDESTSREAVEQAFAELGAKTVEECWTAYNAKRNWLLADKADVEAVVADWDAFTQTLTLPSPEQFDEVSHASGLPTRAEDLGPGYDDGLMFWALRIPTCCGSGSRSSISPTCYRCLVGRDGAFDRGDAQGG